MTIDLDKSCHILTPLVGVSKGTTVHSDTSAPVVPVIRPANYIVTDGHRQILLLDDIHELSLIHISEPTRH